VAEQHAGQAVGDMLAHGIHQVGALDGVDNYRTLADLPERIRDAVRDSGVRVDVIRQYGVDITCRGHLVKHRRDSAREVAFSVAGILPDLLDVVHRYAWP